MATARQHIVDIGSFSEYRSPSFLMYQVFNRVTNASLRLYNLLSYRLEVSLLRWVKVEDCCYVVFNKMKWLSFMVHDFIPSIKDIQRFNK